MCRGVTRLDGAWDNKKVWRPHIRTWGLWEANVPFWKSAYGIVVSFGPPQWFSVRGIFPLPHSLRLWCYAIKIGKCSENKQIFYPNVMNFYSISICNFRTQYGMDFAQFLCKILHCTVFVQTLLSFCANPVIQVSSCSFCVTSMPAPPVFLAWTCVCFANNKTFLTSNKLLF